MQNITLNTATRQCVNPNTFLGYEGENQATTLIFEFQDGFVDGLGQLYIKRGEDSGYVTLDKVGETYQFPVKSSVLSKVGEINMQVVITQIDGTIIKYDVFTMMVKDSIDTDTELPEEYPSWQQAIAEMLANTQEAIEQAENVANQLLQAKENGEFNGKDGFSPSAKVTQTEEGAKIEITDENGTTTAVVKHGQGGGEGGGTGADGFSPIANVTQTEEGAEIVITDKKGTTTAKIYNGKGGAAGEAGKDGLTPFIGDNGNWWLGDTDTGVSAGGSGGSATLPDRAYFNYEKKEAPVTNTFLSLTNTSLRGIELDADGNPILKAGKTYKITLSLYGCNIQNKSTNRFVLSKTKSDGTKNNVSFIYPPSAASAGGQGQNLPSSVCIEVPIKDFTLQIWAIHATVADFVTTGCTSLSFDLMVDEVI